MWLFGPFVVCSYVVRLLYVVVWSVSCVQLCGPFVVCGCLVRSLCVVV